MDRNGMTDKEWIIWLEASNEALENRQERLSVQLLANRICRLEDELRESRSVERELRVKLASQSIDIEKLGQQLTAFEKWTRAHLSKASEAVAALKEGVTV